MSRATVEVASLRTLETPLEPEDIGPAQREIHRRFLANHGLEDRSGERIAEKGFTYDGSAGPELTTLTLDGASEGIPFIARTLHSRQGDGSTKPRFEFAQPGRMRLLHDSQEALAEIDKVNLPPPLDQGTVDQICPLVISAIDARLNRLGPDFSQVTKTFKDGSSLSLARAANRRFVSFVRTGVKTGAEEIINVSLPTTFEVDGVTTVLPATIFLNDLARPTDPKDVKNGAQGNTVIAGLRLRQAFTDLFPIPTALDQLLPADPTYALDDHPIQELILSGLSQG